MTELQALKKRIREEKNLQRRRELENQLLFILIATRYSSEIRSITNNTVRRLESLARSGATSEEVRLTIERTFQRLRATFGEQLYRATEDWWKMLGADFQELSVPEILRAHYGAAVDDEGYFKPQPGRVEDAPEGAPLEELLILASPLLGLIGEGLGPPDVQEPDFDAIVSARRRHSEYWPTKLSLIFGSFNAGAQSEAILLQDPTFLRQYLRSQFEPLRKRVSGELAHEIRRTTNDAGNQFDEDSEAYVGWRLRSRFWPTTAPDHAARDGWVFYKDDRDGATRPWAEQGEYDPPYRKNCVCFKVPIYESELEDGKHNLGVEKYPRVQPRDVGTWDEWYSQQRPGNQRTIVGDRRWFASASFGEGAVTWASMIDTRGRLISANRLASETPAQRTERIRAVQQMLAEQRLRRDRAWQDGRMELSPAEEARYRRRLDSYLRRLQ